METRKKQYGAINKKYQRKQVHRKGFETSKHTYERENERLFANGKKNCNKWECRFIF